MSEQIREQVSAFLDGELPSTETELLLKRLTRDAELRESFGRYALVGESMRGGHVRLTRGFAGRVNRAIDGEPLVSVTHPSSVAAPRWGRRFAGGALAASVTVMAIIAVQQRAAVPGRPAAVMAACSGPGCSSWARNLGAAPVDGIVKLKEPLSYTVPAAVTEMPAVVPAARFTNYVFAHSKYSQVMGQNDVLNDLLSTSDADDTGSQQTPAGTRATP